MKEFLVISDTQKFKAIIDPTRHRVLDILNVKEMSVEELARLLERDVSTTYRHIHKLENAGLIEVARIERKGTSSKKYYRRVAKTIVGVIPSEELSKDAIFRKHMHDEIRKGLLTLGVFGYRIPNDKPSLDKLINDTAAWHKLLDDSIRLRLVDLKDVDTGQAYAFAIKMLTLVETRKNPHLRRTTELLVSELSQYRKKLV